MNRMQGVTDTKLVTGCEIDSRNSGVNNEQAG